MTPACAIAHCDEAGAVPAAVAVAAERVRLAELGRAPPRPRRNRRSRSGRPAGADRGARDAERAERGRARRRRRPPSPREAWKRRTACARDRPVVAVGGDARARAAAPRWCEEALAKVPEEARRADAQRARRDRADDAVDLEPVRGLEAPHGAPRCGPNTPSAGMPSARWTARRVALAAAPQHRLPVGDADGHHDDPGQQRGRHLRAGHPGPVPRGVLPAPACDRSSERSHSFAERRVAKGS